MNKLKVRKDQLKLPVGQRLAATREALGILQSELTMLLTGNKKNGHIANWETGKNLLPPEAAIEFCRWLREDRNPPVHVTLDWLYAGQLTTLQDKKLRRQLAKVLKLSNPE